eukprot:4082533-Amphidinium_carterae.1
MPRPYFADLRGVFKGKGRAKGSGTTSFGGSTGSLAPPSEEAHDEEPQQPNVDEPEPEYQLGMLAGDGTWSAEWSTEQGDAGRVGGPDTAPPGGSPPG